MALSTEEIEERLSEGAGRPIRLKPVPIGVNRLSWETILDRLERGLGIEEGELLPEIPDGISATEFYRYTGISPTIFSMEPFADYERDIANKLVSGDKLAMTGEEAKTNHEAYKKVSGEGTNFWTGDDIESYDDPIGYGPSDGMAGLVGLIPGLGTVLGVANTESPFAIGTSVFKEFFTGEPSGYEPYAQLDNFDQASKAYQNGQITKDQFEGFMSYGPGKYYDDGMQATGKKFEREYNQISGLYDAFGTGDPDPTKYLDPNEYLSDKEVMQSRMNDAFERNFTRFQETKDMGFLQRIMQSWSDGDIEEDSQTGIPEGSIGVLDMVDEEGNSLGKPSNMADATFIGISPLTGGIMYNSGYGWMSSLGVSTGNPQYTMKSMNSQVEQAKAVLAQWKNTGKSDLGKFSIPPPDPTDSSLFTDPARLDPTAGWEDFTGGDVTRFDFEPEFVPSESRGPEDEMAAGIVAQGVTGTDQGPITDEQAFKEGAELENVLKSAYNQQAENERENEQAFREGSLLRGHLKAAYDLQAARAENERENEQAFREGSEYVDAMRSQQYQQYHDDYDTSQPSLSDRAAMDPTGMWTGWADFAAPYEAYLTAVAGARRGGTRTREEAQQLVDDNIARNTAINKVAQDIKAAEQADYDSFYGGEGSDADFSDWGEDDAGAESGWFNKGGQVGMANGGEAPQGAEVDMANLGMVNEQAAAPQEGGQQSVKDDIPREADEGDYILPYETVLQVGLKQLNRYAKEAIQLAIKNGVNLRDTDLDPSDDVPIKISNYEYHIPKALVPYFGGGKKYLDKIRDEGLALRKRLEEEKQPSAQQQQPMQPPLPQEAPPQEAMPQMAANANPMATADQMAPEDQAAPPMPAMMQKGGFVLSPEQEVKSTEQALTSDTSQPAQSAYNQVQAMERARVQKQQPPMVDPTGRVVQQGFAAPKGYQDGAMVEDLDIAQGVEPKTEPPMPDWANRALDPKTPVLMDEETGEPKTLGLVTDEINKMYHVYPTIRMVGKELKQYDPDEALSLSMKKKDSVKFNTQPEADSWSNNLVNQIASLRDLQQPKMPPKQIESPMATVDEQQSVISEGFAEPIEQALLDDQQQQPMVAA